MRRNRSIVLVAGVLAGVLVAGVLPAVAQQYEEYPGPDAETPLSGYTRNDGTIVLSDESFCRFLLGSLWGDDQLTFAGLIDKTKKQKQARRAAFEPGDDEATLTRCADAIGAYRNDPPADDPLVAWSRRSPIVPEALAPLLPADFEARPLARPDEIGPAARTSGFGTEVSAPFEVTAGTWLAEVDDVRCDTWTGVLRDARDSDAGMELASGREYLYDVAQGHYYWDVVASDCDWSVDLVPVDLGPDPDATPLPLVAVPALAGSGWNRGRTNASYLTATQAHQALADVGLTVGECIEEPKTTEGQGDIEPGRVWGQDPVAGTLLELGSGVDVYIVSDCDVVRGERVISE